MGRQKLSRLLAAELAALIAIVLHGYLSDDWCGTSVRAGLLAGLAAYILDWLVEALAEPKNPIPTRAATMIITGLLGGLLFHLTPNGAFQLVFRAPMPEEITDLAYKRRYAGGPGDAVLWMQFSADRRTVEKLIVDGNFKEDPDHLRMCVEMAREHDFRHCVFGGVICKERDEATIAPSHGLRMFKYGTKIPRVTLLWGEVDERVWVLYTLG